MVSRDWFLRAAVVVISAVGCVQGQRTDPEKAARLAQLKAKLQVQSEDRVSLVRVQQFLRDQYAGGNLLLRDSGELERLTGVATVLQTIKDGGSLDGFFRRQAARAGNTNGNEGIQAATVDSFLNTRLDAPFDKTFGHYLGIEPPKDDEKSWLEKQGLSLRVRRSFFESDKTGLPAQVSWTHFGGNDETAPDGERRTFVEVEGAIWLQFDRPLLENSEGDYLFGLWPVFVIEADTSTRASDNRDRIVHRIGVESDVVPRDQGSGVWHHFKATLDFTTDRDYDAEEYGGTVQWLPTIPSLALGLPRPVAEDIKVAWQPYVTATFGSVEDSGGSQALAAKDDYLDVSVRLDAQVKWDRLTLTPEATMFWETQEDFDDHFLFGVTAQWALTDDDAVTLAASYRNGERSPLFQEEERVQLTLGVKF